MTERGDLIEKAEKAYLSSDTDGCSELCGIILESDPECPRACLFRQMCQMELSKYSGRDPEEAFSEVEKAIDDAVMNDPGCEACVISCIDRIRASFRAPEVMLDYDNILIEGKYPESLPLMVHRDYVLLKTLEIRNSLTGENLRDPDMYELPYDYLNLAELRKNDIEKFSRARHFELTPEDADAVSEMVGMMTVLFRYAAKHLSLFSRYGPSRFRRKMNHVYQEARAVIEMVLIGKELDGLAYAFSQLTAVTEEIMKSPALDGLQADRNAKYLEDNRRLYDYVSNGIQELNAQLDACDPYDITNRKYISGLIETSYQYLKAFEKDH